MGKGYVFTSMNRFFSNSENRETYSGTYSSYKTGDFDSFSNDDWKKANSGFFTNDDSINVGYGQDTSSSKKRRPRYQMYWKDEPRDHTKKRYKLEYVWIRNTGKRSKSKIMSSVKRSDKIIDVKNWSDV